MRFTQTELRDLVISIVVLALIFSSFDMTVFLSMLFIITVVFASHEILGHKLVAQYYDCEATYKIWPLGLLLGVVTGMLGGFIFAAPGAVYVSPVVKKNFAFTVARLSKKQYAFVAAAGPIVNTIIGFALVAISAFLFRLDLLILTARISFFLALFNLIPFPPLDGSTIMSWNWKAWLLLSVSSLIGYGLLSTYL